MGSLAVMLCWLDNILVINAGDIAIHGLIWALIVEVILLAAIKEFSDIVKDKGAKVFQTAAVTGASLFTLGYFLKQFGAVYSFSNAHLHLIIMFIAVTSSVMISFYSQARTLGNEGTILNCGATILTVMYLGFFSSFFLAIRVEHGIKALIMFIAVIKLCDVGAYTFGKLFGKHKFAPTISPKKTWEGMAGGCLFSSITGIAMSMSMSIMHWWAGAIFGIMFAFIGQLGDLAESMLKRDANVKDSGAKLPGFGGILDIVDSLILSAPFAYMFFNIFAIS